MDIVFDCPECGQQLEVDSGAAGSQIDCPTCSKTITIPQDESNGEPVMAAPPIAKSAEARVERHFVVPQHTTKADELIQKPAPPLEVAAAKSLDKEIRIKTIKRGDCFEVGKDRFDEVVTAFLRKIGESHLISVHSVNYSHIDLESRQLVNDFGVVIIYRG